MYQYDKNSYVNIREYQKKYYLRNRNQISVIRAEYYINKVKERNKTGKYACCSIELYIDGIR